MFRTLISRRWLGALAVATVFAVAAFFLGRWQWHRYEAKAERADRIHAHYDAPARPIADVLGASPVPEAREWTRVTATGRYAADRTMFVRNRPLDGTYGYEVLVPLRVDGGTTVLVDRGWVPNAENARTLPDVPPAPEGEVTVTGWVRPSEESLDRGLPAGQLASIDLAEAERQLGTPLLGGYVILQSERTSDGATPARPTPLEPPDTGLGPHQAYAFQWWLAMLAGFALVWWGARREYLEGRQEAVEGADGSGVPGSLDGSPADESRRPVPARRKVRIWDEEDG